MVWLHKALMEQFWFLLIKWKQASSTISTYTTRKRETHEPGGKQWGLELPEPLGRQERSRVKRGPWRKRRETEHWGKKEQDWKSCLYSWLFIPGPYRHLPQLHTPSLAGDSCHHHQTCHSLCASHCGLSYLILNDTLEGINLIPILQIRTLKFSELYHSLQITLNKQSSTSLPEVNMEALKNHAKWSQDSNQLSQSPFLQHPAALTVPPQLPQSDWRYTYLLV